MLHIGGYVSGRMAIELIARPVKKSKPALRFSNLRLCAVRVRVRVRVRRSLRV